MAEPLNPCCQAARRQYIERITKALMSYPVIKEIPCPTCRRVIPIRLYVPPSDAKNSA